MKSRKSCVSITMAILMHRVVAFAVRMHSSKARNSVSGSFARPKGIQPYGRATWFSAYQSRGAFDLDVRL